MGDFQDPLDGVVIGDGYRGHALFFGNAVERQRFRIAFLAAQFL